ncbi:hypothetical protein [Helicobacter pylori]|nr:hypothetical protein [Helicobacter pylori]
MPLICYNIPIYLYLAQGSVQSYAFIDKCVRAVGNALEIKLCKIH